MVKIKQQLVDSRAKTYEGTNGRKYANISRFTKQRIQIKAQMHNDMLISRLTDFQRHGIGKSMIKKRSNHSHTQLDAGTAVTVGA